MDKAPTVINLEVELAEMYVNQTPPRDAHTAQDLYNQYVLACEKADRDPLGERAHQNFLKKLCARGTLQSKMYGSARYYWGGELGN